MTKKDFNEVIGALSKIESFKNTNSNKKEEINYSAILQDLQLYIDLSEEKRKLFIDCVKNTIDEKTNKKILEKGIVVYVKRLEVLKILQEDLDKENIEYRVIQGSTSKTNRAKITKWFQDNSENKIVFISDAGGQSITLSRTNEIILYNIPNGYGPFKQIIGRVARYFGDYEEFNIRIISVKDTIDEYLAILISAKKELEHEILNADSIPIKEVNSFSNKILKKIREKLLWKRIKLK
jgi:SNF2 family DNA or RNA helicase